MREGPLSVVERSREEVGGVTRLTATTGREHGSWPTSQMSGLPKGFISAECLGYYRPGYVIAVPGRITAVPGNRYGDTRLPRHVCAV